MPPTLAARADVQVFAEIGMIDQLATVRIERLLPKGVTSPQFGVLNLLAQGREETPAALARTFQVTKGAMTNTLQRLEAQGLVRVSGDPSDGRRKFVAITASGTAVYDASLLALRPMMESLREAFTASEFNDALPFLTALRTWLDETR